MVGWLGFVVLLVVLVLFAADIFRGGDSVDDLRAAAIEHGCAAYDQTTGEWRWK